jgi:Spy/CpxP family protein refolding chaperone
MSKFPWKTALAGAAILAATVYAFAAQLAPGQGSMHEQMMGQMGGMHELMMQRMQGQNLAQAMLGAAGMHGHGAAGGPTMPGQDAFGTIQEIVQILEADPATDWSKVNIAALREHLIDMNEVTLHAAASQHIVGNSLVIEVTGEGRTLAAIKRMVPEHVHMLRSMGWNAKTADLANGVTLTVTAADAPALTKLKALGFIGIMVQGGHHQPHHLMMAKGQFPMH